LSREFDFYAVADVSKYAGSWVAIVNNEVIATGKDLKNVYAEAQKKAGEREPLFARIPVEEETLIL